MEGKRIMPNGFYCGWTMTESRFVEFPGYCFHKKPKVWKQKTRMFDPGFFELLFSFFVFL